ncbi:hypothetical protein [Acinetobacter terrae]|jgi:hypothetical protein|nr:hypothetical protein [Acinetobacter terrae]
MPDLAGIKQDKSAIGKLGAVFAFYQLNFVKGECDELSGTLCD